MDCYSCFSPVKPKEKKATSALISLALLQLKGNPGKHLPKEKTGK